MNEEEIDLMKKLLTMDPYQRITAQQALNHEFFDDLRSKEGSDYEDESSLEVDGTLGGNDSHQRNNLILSPEMLMDSN